MTYSIYYAGGLFDHKELTGNYLLASYIDKVADGEFSCILPQDFELPVDRAEQIRNGDLAGVVQADLALFNFDGLELDSGTVVEFMVAKFLDIPSVLLRTDFRKSGDNDAGDSWNLMCSFYPRTEIVQTNAMADYLQAFATQGSQQDKFDALYTGLARQILDAFHKVLAEPSTYDETTSPEQIYRWIRLFPGSGFDQTLGEDTVAALIQAKRDKGLL